MYQVFLSAVIINPFTTAPTVFATKLLSFRAGLCFPSINSKRGLFTIYSSTALQDTYMIRNRKPDLTQTGFLKLRMGLFYEVH